MIAIADLRDVCGITAGDETYDSRLSDLESETVAWIERRTSRYFGVEAEYTERLKGNGLAKLHLEEAPTSALASLLEYEYVGATSETITASEDDGFEVVTRTDSRATNDGWLERKGCYVWVDGRIYVVTYDRGYALTAAGESGEPDDIAAPGDIRSLVKDMVRFRYFALVRDPTLISETIGGYSYRTGNVSEESFFDAHPMARETLSRWSRMVYA